MAVIDVSTSGGIAGVTLNRPERLNAYTAEMLVTLADTWDALALDPSVRVVLLAAAGDRAFCVGGDLELLVPLSNGSRAPQNEFEQRYVAEKRSILQRALLRNVEFTKPVVAAVNGPAYAGGSEILWGTDLRVASSTATFALPEVRRGIVPSGGSLVRLARQIGWTGAMEMIMMAEPVSAQRARELGIVNWVVEPERVLPTAEQVCATVARGAPLALAIAKETMLRTLGRPLEEGFEIESSLADVVLASADAREGPLAFMEKREPRFQGS